MSGSKEKISFISTARFIGILLVVFGHSYPFDVYIPPILWKVKDFIYLFHMPLFIFISGYLLAKSRRPAGGYVVRRARRLLIPYFVLSLAAFVPKVMVQQFLNDTVELSVWQLLKTELIPRENVWGHFWYIPVVFFLGCIGIVSAKYMREYRSVRIAALIGTLGLLFLPQTTDWLALEDIRKQAFYFTLGMVVSGSEDLHRGIRHPAWLLALPAAVVLHGVGDGVLTEAACACAMIGFVLHVGTRADIGSIPVLQSIERNSFTIFLLSWPAQAVTEVVLNKLLHLPALLVLVCMFLAGIMVPLVCVKIITELEKKVSLGWLREAVGM